MRDSVVGDGCCVGAVLNMDGAMLSLVVWHGGAADGDISIPRVRWFAVVYRYAGICFVHMGDVTRVLPAFVYYL
jgi:hypothetical protein